MKHPLRLLALAAVLGAVGCGNPNFFGGKRPFVELGGGVSRKSPVESAPSPESSTSGGSAEESISVANASEAVAAPKDWVEDEPLAVDVGPDITAQTEVTIIAKTSGAIAFTWSVSAGNGANVTFGSPAAPATTVKAAVAGYYTLRLTVTSASGEELSDELILGWGGDHKIFTTSVTYAGNLGGLAGADAKCAERATASGLAGKYVALLSTTSVNAKARVKIVSRVVRTDGVVVALNENDLWDGRLAATLESDEFGKPTVPNVNNTPWTGSVASGLFSAAGGACGDWTQTTGTTYLGLAYYDDAFWMSYTTTAYGCNGSNPLYCVSSEPIIPK